MSTYKERGIKSFYDHDFDNALFNFSLALKEIPDDYELKVCAILCDIAKDKEEEALSLYEYFKKNVQEEDDESKKLFDTLLDALSISAVDIEVAMQEVEFQKKIQEENGITFSDFMELVEKEGNFKRVFEDIMFSTKVVISNKDDFVKFLNLLVDYGFTEMSLGYIESAISLFPMDERIQILAKKIMK